MSRSRDRRRRASRRLLSLFGYVPDEYLAHPPTGWHYDAQRHGWTPWDPRPLRAPTTRYAYPLGPLRQRTRR